MRLYFDIFSSCIVLFYFLVWILIYHLWGELYSPHQSPCQNYTPSNYIFIYVIIARLLRHHHHVHIVFLIMVSLFSLFAHFPNLCINVIRMSFIYHNNCRNQRGRPILKSVCDIFGNAYAYLLLKVHTNMFQFTFTVHHFNIVIIISRCKR